MVESKNYEIKFKISESHDLNSFEIKDDNCLQNEEFSTSIFRNKKFVSSSIFITTSLFIAGMCSRKWIAKKYNAWKQKNKSKKETPKEVFKENNEHDLEVLNS